MSDGLQISLKRIKPHNCALFERMPILTRASTANSIQALNQAITNPGSRQRSELMSNFDDLVTDRDVHLADVHAHLEHLQGDDLFRGKYRVTRTAGSTGKPGVFLSDPLEWANIIASYSRAQEWAGIFAGISHRTRLAVVSSRVPSHQSSRVGTSVDSPFIPVRRFDSTERLADDC